ncbi:hypothetical protein FGO68_gene16542 [Halteria grandinella]|uniref:Uncharacterized protein n=1 Tax=Halteria grandinella TaxID=5974 RepID=A0A8J8N9A0_HALGN|nr:hypothetical protein FGO68_gene16542 [Halteria grandinella]
MSRGFTPYQQIKALVTTTTFIYIHPVTRITFPHQKRSEGRDEVYSRAISVNRWSQLGFPFSLNPTNQDRASWNCY